MTEDRTRFERRIEAARPALLKRALRSLPASDAEDAVQDTLTIALTKYEWRDILLPEHWVLGVMDFVILSLLSTTRHKTRPLLLDDIDDEESGDPCEVAMEEIAAAQEFMQQVQILTDAMLHAGLTDKERAAIEGRLTGKPTSDLCDELGMEPGSVRKYLSLAIAKVKKHLRAAPDSAHL